MKKASKSTKSGLSALEKTLNSAHGNCKKHNTQLNAKVEVILEICSFFYINFYNFFGEMFFIFIVKSKLFTCFYYRFENKIIYLCIYVRMFRDSMYS